LTSHFSQYAILDQATIDKTIAAQNAKLVKGVKATKILAAKAVAKKGNATVTWKKSPGYKVDGYQIWKSSKKTTGYKMMAKRTGQKYKNTYGLKAGKTYYYKVRGFRAIDGQTVYTKWAKVNVVAK
ncbi:MAG: fibronectin type III domain-containing protein, partial [Anaerovoracaceae bacterium]